MFDDIIKPIGPWKCLECDWFGEEPLIYPGECGGQVVDILDIMCPECSGKVMICGSHEEVNKWWDDWYEKRNGPPPPEKKVVLMYVGRGFFTVFGM